MHSFMQSGLQQLLVLVYSVPGTVPWTITQGHCLQSLSVQWQSQTTKLWQLKERASTLAWVKVGVGQEPRPTLASELGATQALKR